MKVIALLSGGKDSIYNLHHCILNNHEPVCVASLGPPEGQDELDSFMYQTVAHSGLATLAQALELPFFSTSIRGKPLNQSSEYGSRSYVADDEESGAHAAGKQQVDTETEEDETEDLYNLLKLVKMKMPEVQAVAAGAILSNYQRVRVEHVCSRLGLTSIAYLWQRSQRELLDEMIASGQQSVLVKVAGAGLGVQHLGKTLGEMQPILHKLNERYETHVCGEGGEYETFTLDSPIFKKSLRLDETKTIISNPDPHSTVAHLYLSKLSLVEKPDYPVNETFIELQERLRALIRVPEILDATAKEIMEKAQALEKEGGDAEPSVGVQSLDIHDTRATAESKCSAARARSTVVDDWLTFSSISAYGDEAPVSEDAPIEEELKRCFQQLMELLASKSASLLSVSHINLLLSQDSMELFPRINKVYSTYFGTSPPTRACVSVRFPDNDRSRIKLDGVARLNATSSNSRTALHVQSLSYWGAANIGPYSQAITTANRCYIAGQIPLIPCSLTLPAPADFSVEIALSLQHVRRIVEAAAEGRWCGWTEGGIAWIAEESEGSRWETRVKLAREGWQTANSDNEVSSPPMLFVSAAQLPRSASIEWQVTWQTGQVPWNSSNEESSSDDQDTPCRTKKPRKVETEAAEMQLSATSGKTLTWQCSAVQGVAESVVGILGCSINETSRPDGLNKVGAFHSIKAFYSSRLKVPDVERLARRLLLSSTSEDLPAMSFIGSRSIETLAGSGSHDVAFVVIAKVLEQ